MEREVFLDRLRVSRDRTSKIVSHVQSDELLHTLHASSPDEFKLDGIKLRITKGVFNPLAGTTSLAIAGVANRYIQTRLSSNKPVKTVLDMGTGSGALGLIAATNPEIERVVLVDKFLPAIACARKNVKRNLSAIGNTQVQLFHADLFDTPDLKGNPFDLILFNQPFYPSNGDFGLGPDGGREIILLTLSQIDLFKKPEAPILFSGADFVEAEHHPGETALQDGRRVWIAASHDLAHEGKGMSYVYAVR